MSALILLLTGLFLYARFVEPRWLQVKRVPLRLPQLPQAFDGLRIAQISDLHLGGWLRPARLQAWLTRVNALQPDLVLISGDFVEETAREGTEELLATLRSLQAPVLAVPGNHDHRRGVERVCQALTANGIRVLRNEVYTLQRGDAQLHVAGLGDQAWGDDDLDALLERLPPAGPAILLAHEPDVADLAGPTERFALQLSGHTHGGQVRPPLLERPLILPAWGQHYTGGLARVGAMQVYTNRGLGMIRPWFRFNCRPELTLLEVQSDRPAT
ncbi:MAG: metallophosphoesterase [Anaerolineaceae bacterium]|nr:metallophosphoesterase [Anaerolineaceae bacterium]